MNQPQHDHLSRRSVKLIYFLCFLTLVACEGEPPPLLSPADYGTTPDQQTSIPDRFDARMETDAAVRRSFGEPCEEGWECQSDICIDTPNEGRICTEQCAGDCPQGFECVTTNISGDPILICAPDGNDLCQRCEVDSDCDDAEDLCLTIGHFSYCGEACESDEDCPDEFECTQVTRSIEGEGEVSQCVPRSGECAPCLDEDGDGYGVGADCLGYDCDDTNPARHEGAEEVCDLSDNDCDSLIDEELTDLPPDTLACAEIGVCEGSQIECLSGEWACAYPPDLFEELEISCDGQDNDCDGEVDEALDAPPSDLNVGVCEGASKYCAGEEGWLNPDYLEHHINFETLEVSCDSFDNDCDGTTDEGYDLQSDLANCGRCGVSCALPQTQMTCTLGECVFAGCNPNFYDLNQDLTDGCEYGCTLSAEGIEVCDHIDNDCDGLIDEALALPNPEFFNCYEQGVCADTLERCVDGRWRCDYPTETFEQREVTCDGLDNDCDGVIDEQLTAPLADLQEGVCEEATRDCHGENGWVEPSYELYSEEYEEEETTCDTVDNDCDGEIDEGYDLLTDLNNCGVCNHVCQLPQSVMACVDGRCEFQQCVVSFYDLNQDITDGCEYACTPTQAGTEQCDLIDNDCDGLTDESPQPPDPEDFSCRDQGVCLGINPVCVTGEWECQYPSTYQEDETLCDGLDNDCDGAEDEALIAPLSSRQNGVCEGSLRVCTGVTGWVDPDYRLYSGDYEQLEVTCDQIDNDCDGTIDEGYNLQTDLSNCGACGQICQRPQSQMACIGGTCTFQQCSPQFYDLNQDQTDGCEYGCTVSAGGVEVCDLIDNDCDGGIDEEFDLTSDVDHCGACNRACSYDHGVSACNEGTCELNGCEQNFYNLNDDPSDGCEYACTFIHDGDLPDRDNIDEDCDGVDGSLNHAVFLSLTGSDAQSGLTRDEPVISLTRALEIAKAQGRSQILVANGTYELTSHISWDEPIGLFGGYNSSFTSRNSLRATFVFSSGFGFVIESLTAPTQFKRVNIQILQQSGESAIVRAVNVYDSSDHFSMEECDVWAGKGGPGRSGINGNLGNDGTNGANASGSTGGVGGTIGGGLGASGRRRAAGLQGQSGSINQSVCGGVGGAASGTLGLDCNDGDPRPGGNGGVGCTGFTGSQGNHGNSLGLWLGRLWLPSNGSTGNIGGVGGGGGGGGSGGGEDCTSLGVCLYCGTGQGGGGGGGGGSGGTGGSGGIGGGASFGFVIYNSTITLKSSSVRSSGGGDGGDGGQGGAGGSGGSGGSGATSSSNKDGDGGDGGRGGGGGAGGCGGGGGGGPSILFVGSGTVRLVGIVIRTPGAGGLGGSSCDSNAPNGASLVQLGVTVELQ